MLSIVAAGVSALLYVPARRRLADFSSRLVHGERGAPDELLRTFGARLSRAVPLDELLLQLAESLRRGLALDAAEIWTVLGRRARARRLRAGRGPATLRLTASEERSSRTAASPVRPESAVWLPQLLADRGDAHVRVAPIAHAGELFGLIVVDRSADAEPFDEQADSVLAELARQVATRAPQRAARLGPAGLARRSCAGRPTSCALSRARVVAAADAERRRIERDLHDGAQQHLVALAANLGAVRALIDSDPEAGARRCSTSFAPRSRRRCGTSATSPTASTRRCSRIAAWPRRSRTPPAARAIPTRLDAATAASLRPGGRGDRLLLLPRGAPERGQARGRGRPRNDPALGARRTRCVFEVADDGPGLDPARTTSAPA